MQSESFVLGSTHSHRSTVETCSQPAGEQWMIQAHKELTANLNNSWTCIETVLTGAVWSYIIRPLEPYTEFR